MWRNIMGKNKSIIAKSQRRRNIPSSTVFFAILLGNIAIVSCFVMTGGRRRIYRHSLLRASAKEINFDLQLRSSRFGHGTPQCVGIQDKSSGEPFVVLLAKLPKDVDSGAADDFAAPSSTTKTASPDLNPKIKASKREMMGFALPALGIFLTNPLLSNIDNAFVGRTAGTSGLASLSPATILTDQVLYLFSFLGRATTGLVSRAYGKGKDVDAARNAASAPLTVSLLCGMILSVLYALFTPKLLMRMRVNPALIPSAAKYVYWRGAIAWAALAQSSSLLVLLATGDAVTPLVIVTMAAAFNVLGDFALCVWPFRWGCAGAAAATSAATLVSSGFMLRALKKKALLPSLRLPTWDEMKSLLEFTGPLLAITITRLVGFVSMQRMAMRLGVMQVAGYQICVNILLFFLLFGEPLSQLGQTKLPALVDSKDGDAVLANLKSLLILGVLASAGVGMLSFGALRFGSGLFTTDATVQVLVRRTAPAVFLSVAQAIIAITIDGANLAGRDFNFMLMVGTATCLMQLSLLRRCRTLAAIFGTFTFRLGTYTVLSSLRVAMGKGALGSAIRERGKGGREGAKGRC